MQTDFFDSFVCNRKDCLEKVSKNSFILNCFHTICSSHIQTEDLFCTDELCALMQEDNPSYIALPPITKRCQNIVNARLANQVVCLFNAKQMGPKCTLCDFDNGTLQFCTICPTVLCHDHRQNRHILLGPKHSKHIFADITRSTEDILTETVRSTKNQARSSCSEIEEHIGNLLMNKESIDFSLVNLENSIKLVHNRRLELLEEAEVSFTQIRRHIERMQEDLLEQLNCKSDTFLRILEQKRTVLQFQSAAASRALNLAGFIRNSKIKVSATFIDMFSENSIAFIKQLFEIPPQPIELINLPKIIRNTLEELEKIHPVNLEIPSPKSSFSDHFNAHYYFDCNKETSHPVERQISYFELEANNCLYVALVNEGDAVTDINWDGSTKQFFYYDSDINSSLHSIAQVNPANNCSAIRGTKIEINLIACRETGQLNRISLVIKIYSCIDDSYSIDLHFEKKPISLSIFSLTPGNLTCSTCSSQKLYGINKNGKEILVFDVSHEIISEQMDKTEPMPFKQVTKFGSNNFMEPYSIAALRALIFVSDCSYNSIFCFTEDGSFIRKFGRLGTNAGQFNKPMGIFSDQMNGRLVVADSGNGRVQILVLSSQEWQYFDVEDEFETRAVPIDVNLDTMGNFFILTESNSIIKFDKNFKFPISILYTDSLASMMPFFAIDRNDVIYLCTKEEGSVYTIKRNGSGVYNFNKYSFIPKRVHPAGMTFDEENRFYITHNKPIDSDPQTPTTSLVCIITPRCENES